MDTNETITRLLKYRDLMVERAQETFEQTKDASFAMFGYVQEAERADRVAKNRIASLYDGYTALPFHDDDEDWFQELLQTVEE